MNHIKCSKWHQREGINSQRLHPAPPAALHRFFFFFPPPVGHHHHREEASHCCKQIYAAGDLRHQYSRCSTNRLIGHDRSYTRSRAAHVLSPSTVQSLITQHRSQFSDGPRRKLIIQQENHREEEQEVSWGGGGRESASGRFRAA